MKMMINCFLFEKTCTYFQKFVFKHMKHLFYLGGVREYVASDGFTLGSQDPKKLQN